MNERGFTLAELLVASAVLGFLMLGVFTIQRQGLGAYQVGAARVEVQQNARAALETMFGEIRTAEDIKPNPAWPGFANACGTGPVPTGGGATSISMTYVKRDPATGAETKVGIDYQLNGTNLERRERPDPAVFAGAFDTLIGGVQTLRVWCYDVNDALTPTISLIRSVHVQVSTRTESVVAATSDRNQHAFMETRVRLRNL
jgi:prepilin-type N-terminal cleavage/methylation domain-containing protein